jgi:hypothetical protein
MKMCSPDEKHILRAPPDGNYDFLGLTNLHVSGHYHAINVLLYLNQQRTEKKSFFIQINFAKAVHLMTHRHNIVLKIRITLGTGLILHQYIVARINS